MIITDKNKRNQNRARLNAFSVDSFTTCISYDFSNVYIDFLMPTQGKVFDLATILDCNGVSIPANRYSNVSKQSGLSSLVMIYWLLWISNPGVQTYDHVWPLPCHQSPKRWKMFLGHPKAGCRCFYFRDWNHIREKKSLFPLLLTSWRECMKNLLPFLTPRQLSPFFAGSPGIRRPRMAKD